MRRSTTAEARPDEGKAASSDAERPSVPPFSLPSGRLRFEFRLMRSRKKLCATELGVRPKPKIYARKRGNDVWQIGEHSSILPNAGSQ
jgi:hypothetical protein